jgi:hypothetical protein
MHCNYLKEKSPPGIAGIILKSRAIEIALLYEINIFN